MHGVWHLCATALPLCTEDTSVAYVLNTTPSLQSGGRPNTLVNNNTVNSLLTDTLVSGQLYLRTRFEIPVLTLSQTLYLHIPVSGHSQ